MLFKIVGRIAEIEIIATGKGIRETAGYESCMAVYAGES